MSFILTPNAKKELKKMLEKMKMEDLKQTAKVLKNELSFSYSKMKKDELVQNLYSHLSENPHRIKSIIEALAKGKIAEYM